MKVPLVDLHQDHAALREQLDAAIASVIDTGRFIGGPEVTSFEEELALVANTAFAIGVSSGTDALLVSLMAIGIGRPDEVVTTPFSFFATAGVIARLGARPVFADIEEHSFNLDPRRAESVRSDKTKAFLPVHLYGRPATLPTGLPVLEDAAQSLSATDVEGIAAAVSFFPTKNLGAFGDAGAVVTNNESFADRVRVLRNHGARPKYFHALIGGNFRLDAMQAAILRVKLPHLAGWTAARRTNSARYRGLFSNANVPPELRLPRDVPNHIYNQFVIRAPRRDELRRHLSDAGVSTEVYYPQPCHLQACFAHLGYEKGSFPIAERAAREVLALPIYPSLTADQQAYVVEQIAAFYT